MDLRDPDYIPDGWVKTSRNKRIVFLSPKPERVVVQGKTMLKDFQRQGRFLEVDLDRFDFRGLVANDYGESVHEVIDSEPMEVDEMVANTFLEISSVKIKGAEQQRDLVVSRTKLLENDPINPVNHELELEKASEIIRKVLENSDNLQANFDVKNLREELTNTVSNGEFMETLKSNKDMYAYFSDVMKAKLLSEIINLPLDSSSPLVGWPTNVRENIYCEIVKLADSKAKEVLSVICSVILPKNQPVSKDDVIRVADIFSTLAHTVSRKQNALAKLKSIVLQTEGLSTSGLDRLARLKGTESSTTLSRGRHLLVELGESSFQSRVKNGQSFSVICDNLNLKQQNMTQSVIHFDSIPTHHLSNVALDPKLLPKLFDSENFLLGSPENKAMLDHFNYVTAVRVGKSLVENVNEASKLNKCLPHVHKHGRQKEEIVQSEIFIPPPDYLNETDNAEFFEFCLKKQSEFLNSVAESVEDKTAFVKDLNLIRCVKVLESGVLESEEEVAAREKAEKRVLEQVEHFGRWVGFGDALTFKQFWLGAKALAQGNFTAVERLDFLPHFRLALFHGKMNKTYMDMPILMPKKAMMEAEGTLPELVAIAGIQGISVEEKKIGNAYEKHDQLVMCIGHLYVANMFRNFLKDEPKALDGVVNEATAIAFVLKMLERYDVELYFDPEREKVPEGKWDDPANYARDAISRMVLSEIFDAGEEEQDWYLLKCLRKSMVVYFLNRKYKVQDSKYAAFLLLDEIFEEQASERDRERMNQAVCVNPSGKRGGGLFA